MQNQKPKAIKLKLGVHDGEEEAKRERERVEMMENLCGLSFIG